MPTATGIERRRLRRVMKRIPAAFEAGKLRGKGHIKNISKEGLFVRATVLPHGRGRGADRLPRSAGQQDRGTRHRALDDPTAPPEEKAKPGFGVYIERGNEEFNDFFEGILTG